METQRCCYTTLSSSRYQSDLQNVLYFLYGGLLVQFLGQELAVIFTYFYFHYIDGGMVSALPAVAHVSNPIRSLGSTSGGGPVLRMPTNKISTLLLGVRLSPCTAPLLTSLTRFFFSDRSFW
jgi:hypothetical protein